MILFFLSWTLFNSKFSVGSHCDLHQITHKKKGGREIPREMMDGERITTGMMHGQKIFHGGSKTK
jgi:hypothetical protein